MPSCHPQRILLSVVTTTMTFTPLSSRTVYYECVLEHLKHPPVHRSSRSSLHLPLLLRRWPRFSHVCHCYEQDGVEEAGTVPSVMAIDDYRICIIQHHFDVQSPAGDCGGHPLSGQTTRNCQNSVSSTRK